MKLCAIRDCKNEEARLGLCFTHYRRMKLYGSPAIVKVTQYHGLSLKERFLKRVKKTSSCWLWLGATNGKGYGMISIYDEETKQSRGKLAPRVSWKIFKGEIPEGLFVCHSCDNPACVNPDHLFLGDQMANLKDMIAKGRAIKRGMKGEEHPAHILTKEQVKEIRESKETGIELAFKYSVSTTTISDIRNRRIWKHLL